MSTKFLFNINTNAANIRVDAERHLASLLSDNCDGMHLHQRDALLKLCGSTRKNAAFKDGEDVSARKIFSTLFSPFSDILSAYRGAFPDDSTAHIDVFAKQVRFFESCCIFGFHFLVLGL